jgi:hypothetical protein
MHIRHAIRQRYLSRRKLEDLLSERLERQRPPPLVLVGSGVISHVEFTTLQSRSACKASTSAVMDALDAET